MSRKTEGSEKRRARVPSGCRIDATDLARFRRGTHDRLYDKLGAFSCNEDGRDGVAFAVWAPHAERVSVIGGFNEWKPEAHALQPIADAGFWCGFVPGVVAGAQYKFHIQSRFHDYRVDKADPFAVRAETPPGTASVVWHLDHDWGDDRWMGERGRRSAADAPISIYELHVGSWKRDGDGGFLGYRRLADELVPYLVRMGFTHVELLPLAEHPFYGSWGYQATGYFAASSRYGEPQDLMALIDRLHRAGIGVILDWVPSHFPGDEHGPVFFDGTHLFEPEDPRLGYHPDWNSCIFDYGRREVQSFLLSSALFWLDRFHIDALRVDAVASMLYRNYSRPEGQWLPNKHGGPENLEAITFLRRLNQTVHERFPDVRTIAEEAATWPASTTTKR
jgi:1,4-alpha-glucan branching enzyme